MVLSPIEPLGDESGVSSIFMKTIFPIETFGNDNFRKKFVSWCLGGENLTLQFRDLHLGDLPSFNFQDFKLEVPVLELLACLRHSSEKAEDEAADRIELR